MKKTFYCEAAYAIGLACLALSTALMATADFGVSMVVAPAYILHLKVSEFLPFFSFGMAEYLLQLVLIVFLAVVLRRVKLSYPASFATAVLYGFLLDGFLALVALLPVTVLAVRIAMFVAGFFLCAGSISLLPHLRPARGLRVGRQGIFRAFRLEDPPRQNGLRLRELRGCDRAVAGVFRVLAARGRRRRHAHLHGLQRHDDRHVLALF